jgi:ribA/ribD-fused uncharacterized protein
VPACIHSRTLSLLHSRSIPKMSSISAADFATLSANIAKMQTQIEQLLKLVKSAPASSADAPAPVAATEKKKRGRAKVDPADKPKCPDAADGVIRFYSSAGENKYKAFSNLFRATFTVDDKEYLSVEHFLQTSKFLTTDPEYAEKIRGQKNPVLVTGMGRTKEHTPAADYEDRKAELLTTALRAKFAMPELKELLLGTGDATIEFENPTDAVMGIGSDGSGANALGQALMATRAALKAA